MLSIPFDNSYARLPARFFAQQDPVKVRAPSLIAFNAGLARDLGITAPDETELAQVFAGNAVPDGATPIAQAYAGHQFGQFNPQLGDGRAVLLGEVIDQSGLRRDIQLKGSGQTPFSRRGDGRAWLGPVLREYVVSEAMHALGVPTTRALAATRTGQDVFRETALPGAVLTRVAASHIRVGTFQLFSSRQDYEGLQTLFDYTVDRHYPTATSPEDLLRAVGQKQVDLVAQWLSIGFIHGVMNTDNCSLSGETIDYGPCAFLEAYNPDTVFSSIDRRGRYGYAAQADIILWNMAQLATALVPLLPDTDAAIRTFTQIVHAMQQQMRDAWLSAFAAKLGISAPQPEDAQLIGDLLVLMDANQVDFTNGFRGLSDETAHALFKDETGFDTWEKRWKTRIETEENPHALMQMRNPALIPRNHQIEAMIIAAVNGDDAPFHRMNRALSSPYLVSEDFADLRAPAHPDEAVRATFCGT
ncbi:MAG: YdiU family protein [Pelagimonas sp.]|jgi:uncharacterized protein YdiU (UPF0061 family)|nr:YdiU family protein [Pelagimonas sp.]